MIREISLDIDYVDPKGRRKSTRRTLRMWAREIKEITWEEVADKMEVKNAVIG